MMNSKDSIYPGYAGVQRLSKLYNRIPLYKQLNISQVEFLSVLKALSQKGDVIFLESAKTRKKWSRFSFLGINPCRCISFNKKGIIENKNGKSRVVGDDLFAFLKSEIRNHRSPTFSAFGNFNGGLAGFFSYDLVNYCGILRRKVKESSDFPLALLLHIDDFIVFDNVKNKFFVSTPLYVSPSCSLKDNYKKAALWLAYLEESIISLLHATSLSFLPSKPNFVNIKFLENKQNFVNKVQKTKELLAAGEAIQVVLSMRAVFEKEVDPYLFYLKLRSVNPSPYMFYLKIKDFYAVGSSPEIHIKVLNGEAYLKPIAGTVGQGKTRKENRENKAKLLSDEKEQAEHLMLVDLARNDLARINGGNPIVVKTFMQPEDYSHVIHLVSLVHTKIGDHKDIVDVLKETFPAGTVSGAPKVRAIEIIDELEDIPRGPYAGAVGYVGYNGVLDTCIAIRTAYFTKRENFIQAGAGIVYDSIPEKEYEEVQKKLEALSLSLQYAKKQQLEESLYVSRY